VIAIPEPVLSGCRDPGCAASSLRGGDTTWPGKAASLGPSLGHARATDPNDAGLWSLMIGTDNGRYDAYQSNTVRPIPLVVVEPGTDP
jgi:hypothetical protein